MQYLRRVAIVAILGALVSANTGCVGLFANMIHAGWGNLADARFDQLPLSKVAVVCMSGPSAYGNSMAAEDIAQTVERLLSERIPEITIVNQQAIDDWKDRNDWNETDYRELADGLQVDYLIAIDLGDFTLYNGPTLYKGSADVVMKVYKTETGEVAYESPSGKIQFPVNGGQHVADTDERAFRAQFIQIIGGQLARHFYSYDVKEDYGRDPTFVVQ